MVSYALLALAVAVAALIAGLSLPQGGLDRLGAFLRLFGLGLIGVAGLFLLVTGRPTLGLGALAVAVLLYILSDPRRGGARSHRRGAGQSTVRTPFLDMVLDHETGEIAGRVRKGRFSGRDLSSLSPAELFALWNECAAADMRSAQLIEAYLDRVHPDWRSSASSEGQAARQTSAMTIEEAYRELGLSPGAKAADVRKAHRQLMQKHHPDRGGDTETAARLNRAKDILLEHLRSG